jgi:hypothetical protein
VHLTAPSHWSRSVGTGGRDASERVGAITGMRTNGRVKSQLFGTVALGTVALLRVDRRYAGHHRSAKHHDENTEISKCT